MFLTISRGRSEGGGPLKRALRLVVEGQKAHQGDRYGDDPRQVMKHMKAHSHHSSRAGPGA